MTLAAAAERRAPWDDAEIGGTSASSGDEGPLLQQDAAWVDSLTRWSGASRWVSAAALLLCAAGTVRLVGGGHAEAAAGAASGEPQAVFPPHPRRRADGDALAAMLAEKAILLAAQPETNDAFEQAKDEFKKANRSASGVASQFSGSQFDEAYAKALFDNITRGIGPKMDLSNGNTCADDEELHGGLCYMKCELLTNGTHPFRSTAMSCCKSELCNPLHMSWKASVCGGYDRAGDSQGIAKCPHPPGTCLLNEELSFGICYKKCSEINAAYPNRVGPSTCCNSIGYKCLDPRNLKTGTYINVGGGVDDDDPNTPDRPHYPLTSLTQHTL